MDYSIAEIAQNLAGPYHIYKEGIEAQILAFFSRQNSTHSPQSKLHFYLGTDLQVQATGEAKAPAKGMIQVIPMEGVIGRKSDPYFGIVGTKDIIQRLSEGNSDPNVIGHMIVSATPGGSALPTREAAIAVQESTKPVGLYAEELWASAGVYIGAGAKKIYAGKSSFSGSIGTVWSALQLAPMFEKWGAKQLTIYANESFDKDLGLKEALAGKPDKLKNALVEPFNALFLNHVKSNRPGIKDEALHGMMYLPEQGVEVGLIDEICAFQEAMSDFFSICNKISKNTIKTNSSMKHLWLSVASFFGATTATKADGTEKTEAELHNEVVQNLTELNNQVKLKDAKITELQNQLTEATNKLNTANSSLEAEKNAHQVTKDALTAADPTTRKEELKSDKTDEEQKQNTTDDFAAMEAQYEAEARAKYGIPALKKDK